MIDSDVSRRIDAQSVSHIEFFPCPAAGARGNRSAAANSRRAPGRTNPSIDRIASDIWLSAAVGAAALRPRNPY